MKAEEYGYPACAGIDPWFGAVRMNHVRLPRMRGDRPDVYAGHSSHRRATPHARGSTWAPAPDTRRHSGYPACAGIDRDRVKSGLEAPGLPRMRGDRPDGSNTATSAGKATPHARGSTRCLPIL